MISHLYVTYFLCYSDMEGICLPGCLNFQCDIIVCDGIVCECTQATMECVTSHEFNEACKLLYMFMKIPTG